MKRNTKGFTLIELLAVIVILAIIALIATPIILNMINDAKKSADKDSAYAYIDAAEKYITLAQTEVSTQYNGKMVTAVSNGTACEVKDTYTTHTGTAESAYDCDDFLNSLTATVKGTKPQATSTITIDANGNISAATLKYSNSTWYYYDNDLHETAKGE